MKASVDRARLAEGSASAMGFFLEKAERATAHMAPMPKAISDPMAARAKTVASMNKLNILPTFFH
jgi:hypothetical protein